jgi:hypothetical protein
MLFEGKTPPIILFALINADKISTLFTTQHTNLSSVLTATCPTVRLALLLESVILVLMGILLIQSITIAR